MKQSKVKKAVKASCDDVENQDVDENDPAATTKACAKKATPEKKPPDTEKAQPAEQKPAAKSEAKKQPDALIRFQTMEWHILTLAGSNLKKQEKQERLEKMLAEFNRIGAELKSVSRKKFGLSATTVDTRIELTGELAKQIIASGKQFTIENPGKADQQTLAAMNQYEASEWQVLEQALKAKAAAQCKDGKRQATEQQNLFKSAENYFGSAAGLAEESEKVGIPKQIVQMRTEQRLNRMGDDPDLKDMRNPSPDAYMLSGSAVFMHYIKELIEKLAKAIKSLLTAKSTPNAVSESKSVENATTETKKENAAAETNNEKVSTQPPPAAVSAVRL
jgi:hypothetical protein